MKAVFWIRQAMRGFRSFRIVHGIVILSFALAMVMPYMAISIVRDLAQNSSPYYLARADQTVVVSAFMPSLRPNVQFEDLMVADERITKMAVKTFEHGTIVDNPRQVSESDGKIASLAGDNPSGYYVYGISANYFDFAIGTPFEGRVFSAEDIADAKYVCIIGSSTASSYGITLGSSIQVNGIPYEVIGITGGFWQHTGVYIPYTRYADVASLHIQHSFLVEYEKPADWEALKSSLSKKLGNLTSFETVAESRDKIFAQIMDENREMLMLAVIATAVALFNVMLVLLGKMKCAYRSIATKYAIGAKTLDLFGEYLISNVIQFLCAMPVLLLFCELIVMLAPDVFRFARGTSIYLSVILFGLFVCVLLSTLLIANIKRINIVEMMRKAK